MREGKAVKGSEELIFRIKLLGGGPPNSRIAIFERSYEGRNACLVFGTYVVNRLYGCLPNLGIPLFQ